VTGKHRPTRGERVQSDNEVIEMSTHAVPKPVKIDLRSPGIVVLMVLSVVAAVLVLWRLAFGLGTITNLDDSYPWGVWIAIDVASGVALSAGGFTTAFIAHILHRHRYEEIVRPALLTAVLGYTFVAIGVFTDLGQYYDIWHLMLPRYWQPNSVLFEVGVCVMMYLTVLWIEFIPVIVERFKGRVNLPGEAYIFNGLVERLLDLADRTLSKVMFVFVILGVVLSCAHQSSLGTLMVIAPTKVHPLWWSPFLPLMFLLSAFAVGYPMVTFESIWAHRSMGLKTNVDLLADLTKFVPPTIGLYLLVKVWDMIHRGTYVYLDDFTVQSNLFLVELIVGTIIPLIMFSNARIRRSESMLFLAATLYVVFGVMLNRINVFITSYSPPHTNYPYIPRVPEVLVTVGYISMLILLYRLFVAIFPVLVVHEQER